MSKPDSLFQLIKILSFEEKRQFAKMSKINKKDTVYEALFKAMDKQQVYDEGKLKKKYRNEAFVKNLSNRKNQLTDKLLDLLVGMNSGDSNEAKIKHTLTYLPVLFQRKQYVLMRKKINSTKKIAIASEQFYLLLELLEWEKKMVWYDTQKKYDRTIEEIILEQEKCLQKFNEQFAYRNLRRRMSIINRKDVMLEKEENIIAFRKLMQNPLLNKDLNFLSKEAEMHYCHIKITYFRIENKFSESLAYAKQLLELCEKLKEVNTNDYEMALHTYLVACDSANAFQHYPENIKKLETILQGSKDEIYIFSRINFYWLRYYLGNLHFEEALEKAELIEKNGKN